MTGNYANDDAKVVQIENLKYKYCYSFFTSRV